MENNSGILKLDDEMGLPPGFRFHPTDEELISHYLANKFLDSNFSSVAIGEVNMNKVEPWELPWKAKLGEKEWYFFCVRDKKYPTGLRTNRATAAGYWKATGKDKEIFRGKTLVGMKKTLVFYIGRAPKGEKSNWVIHEYRLEGKLSPENLPKLAKNDWVISRVFHKTSGGKKDHISGLIRMNSLRNELDPLPLPPLMDSSPNPGELDLRHVHCFSNSNLSPQQKQENMIHSFNNPIFTSSSNATDSFAFNNQFYGQFPTFQGGTGFQFPGLSPLQDPSLIKSLFGNYYGQNMSNGFLKQKEMVSLSQETENSSVVSNLETGKRSFEEQEAPSTSIGAQDLDCIWSY